MMDLLYLKSFNAEETSRGEEKKPLNSPPADESPQLLNLRFRCVIVSSQGTNELMCLGVKILGAVSSRLITLILRNRAFALKKKTFAHHTDTQTHTRTGKGGGIPRSVSA